MAYQAYSNPRGSLCLEAAGNCEEKGEEGEVPGVCKGSGNATPGVESVGLPAGGRRPGIIGRLQGGTLEDPPPDQKGDLLPGAERQFEALCSAVRIIQRHLSNE